MENDGMQNEEKKQVNIFMQFISLLFPPKPKKKKKKI